MCRRGPYVLSLELEEAFHLVDRDKDGVQTPESQRPSVSCASLVSFLAKAVSSLESGP